jgi:hypothetical protein
MNFIIIAIAYDLISISPCNYSVRGNPTKPITSLLLICIHFYIDHVFSIDWGRVLLLAMSLA